MNLTTSVSFVPSYLRFFSASAAQSDWLDISVSSFTGNNFEGGTSILRKGDTCRLDGSVGGAKLLLGDEFLDDGRVP